MPRERILRSGNFFFSISNLPLLTPKNSIGLTVSRLMIVSVKSICLRFKIVVPIIFFPDLSDVFKFNDLKLYLRLFNYQQYVDTYKIITIG